MHDLMTASQPRRREGAPLALTALTTAVVTTAAGFLIGGRWALPALNALAVYPVYIGLIMRGRMRQALVLALLWALFLSQAVIVATYFFPERAETVIWRAEEYRNEMFDWVATGGGAESSPSQFIPMQLRDFAVFSVVCFLTVGLGGLVMGAMLLNYMNFYVGSLVLGAQRPVATLLLAWQPYALVRVAAYILVACALTELAVALLRRRRLPRRVKSWMALGVAGIFIDILVKSAIAPLWSRLLSWASGL